MDKRLVEEEPLHIVALDALEVFGLRLGFDTFGDDFLVELVGHLHHVADNDIVLGIGGADMVQERLVELDGGDVVVLEHVQRGISGAEVVDGYGNTVFGHRVHELHHGGVVIEIGRFGQFHFDVLAWHVVLAYNAQDVVG